MKRVALGELCTVKGGKRLPKGEPYAISKTAHPYIRVCDFVNGSVVEDDLKYISEATQTKIKRYTISSDDVYISIAGTIGLVGLVPQHLSGANLTENAAKIEIHDPAVLDKGYLAKYLATEGQTEIASKTKATSQPKLALFRIAEIPIPLPPLAEQKRIAAILDAADALRAKRRESLAQLDSLLQATFLDMFGDPEGNSWETVTVEDVARSEKGSIRTGPFGSQLLHGEFVDEGVTVLGIDNAVANEFQDGEPRFITSEKYEQLKRYTVKPGDVLITIMGTCGRCAIVPEDIGTAINTKHLCCITLDHSKCLPSFMHRYFLMHPSAQKYLERSAKGAIMSGLNMGIIKGLPILVPPLDLQRRFATIVESVEQQKVRLRDHLTELDTLFASLQQRAFNGKL